MAAMSRRAFGVVAAAALTRPAFATDELKAAVGQQGAWETSITDLAQRGGFLAKRGISAEILYTQGGGETLQAVISGSADIGVGVGMTGVLGAFAKGAPVRIMSAQATGPADFWYVKPSSPIQLLKDYKQPVTVAFSTTGSSTHTGILRFAKAFGLAVTPVATGSPQATLTQLLSDQIDVGWSTPPVALDRVYSGGLRIVGSPRDIPAVRNQTIRVNVVNSRFLARQPDIIARYVQAYRDTLDWMYDDPASIAAYGAYSGFSADLTLRAREQFFPKSMLVPDHISGLADSMEDSIDFKALSRPLTDEQVKQLVQIPHPL